MAAETVITHNVLTSVDVLPTVLELMEVDKVGATPLDGEAYNLGG